MVYVFISFLDALVQESIKRKTLQRRKSLEEEMEQVRCFVYFHVRFTFYYFIIYHFKPACHRQTLQRHTLHHSTNVVRALQNQPDVLLRDFFVLYFFVRIPNKRFRVTSFCLKRLEFLRGYLNNYSVITPRLTIYFCLKSTEAGRRLDDCWLLILIMWQF